MVKKPTLLTLAICCVAAVFGVMPEIDRADRLWAAFTNPPDAVKPWCYWMWVNGHVDRETITADLEAMKRMGFGGILMFDNRGYWDDDKHVVNPKAEFDYMSPQWLDYLVFSLREAARLGLEFSMNLGSGGGKLIGPWDVGADAPKRLVYRYYAPGAPFEKPDLPHYSDITSQDVWYTGADIPLPSGWQDGGEGEIARSDANVERITDIGSQGPRRTLAAKDTPGAKRITVRYGCAALPGHEYDVDVLDPAAVEGHVMRCQKAIWDRVPDLVGRGKTLTHLYSVSWEGSMPTWTGNFPAEFKRLAGFDIMAKLPLLAGFTLRDEAANENFRRVYRRIRLRMFQENCYGTLVRTAEKHGLGFFSESGGPFVRRPQTFLEADQLALLSPNAFPQGEFWWEGDRDRCVRSRFGRYHTRGVVAAAHLYGKRRISAEAFTHMRRHWIADPAALKPLADEAYADGINHFVWHTFTCSPAKFGVPGAEYFAGTHVNRNVTWHREADAFVRYLGRCQAMLQKGMPVAGYALYSGSNPYQHWGRFRDIPFLGSSTKLPAGYTYDMINDEVLLTRAKVADGKIVLPDGMTYGALVIDLLAPDRPVNPRVLEKIDAFRAAGLPVFTGGEINRLAEVSPPDFEGPSGFSFTHRRDGKTDFYFIQGTGKASVVLDTPMDGRAVETWDAVTGTRCPADASRTADGRTRVSLDLPETGSCFVVFTPAERPAKTAAASDETRVIAVPGPWRVSFAYHDGISAEPPAPVEMPFLRDWTTCGDDGVYGSTALRYFAGTARYRATATLTPSDAAAVTRLSLGEVPSGLAHVTVNGRDCGTAWCPPWEVDVSSAVRAGENEIEIRYVNNWANRLTGDCFLPPESRVTKSIVRYWTVPRIPNEKGWLRPTVYSGPSVSDPLQSSGLLGPVWFR